MLASVFAKLICSTKEATKQITSLFSKNPWQLLAAFAFGVLVGVLCAFRKLHFVPISFVIYTGLGYAIYYARCNHYERLLLQWAAREFISLNCAVLVRLCIASVAVAVLLAAKKAPIAPLLLVTQSFLENAGSVLLICVVAINELFLNPTTVRAWLFVLRVTSRWLVGFAALSTVTWAVGQMGDDFYEIARTEPEQLIAVSLIVLLLWKVMRFTILQARLTVSSALNDEDGRPASPRDDADDSPKVLPFQRGTRWAAMWRSVLQHPKFRVKAGAQDLAGCATPSTRVLPFERPVQWQMWRRPQDLPE